MIDRFLWAYLCFRLIFRNVALGSGSDIVIEAAGVALLGLFSTIGSSIVPGRLLFSRRACLSGVEQC